MKKILVPVDFSTHTEASCNYAISIARLIKADIILFHSFFDQVYFSDGGFSTSFESGIMLTDEIILDFYKQKETRLENICGNLRNLLKTGEHISISWEMESGDPDIQIINAIEKHQPDLIIMGSSGMGKKRIMAGSVARRIMDHAIAPVIAVPNGTSLTGLKNLAYMSSFESMDMEALYIIDILFQEVNLNYFIMHILKGDVDPETKGKMALLTNKVMNNMPARKVGFHVIEGGIEPGRLQEIMNENKIDLISFIPHKRNIFQNFFYQGLTKEDLFLTMIPVMAVKPVTIS